MRMQSGGRSFAKSIQALIFSSLACFSPGLAEAQSPTAKKFGSWELQCAASAKAETQVCALTQTVRSEEQPSASTIVAFRKLPGSTKSVLQIIAPPNAFLIEGAKIKVDQDDVGTLPFFRCSQLGCAAEGGVSEEITDKLLSGKNMLVTIYINPGEGLRNIFPLEGFKDGLKALQ